MIIIASYSNVSVTYTADGTQTVFSFPFDYLRKAFVKVEVNEETILVQGEDYSVSDNKTVVFTEAPELGTIVRVFRETSTQRLVSWADASVLRAKDMTIQQVQNLHILEEQQYWQSEYAIIRDGREWNARNFPIKNTGDPVDPKDATNKEYVDNTALIENPDGTVWEGRGLPVSNIATPGKVKDAATKEYVDNLIDELSVEADRYVVFNNVAAMIAADLPAGYNTRTLGYYDINDGGAGTYSIRGKVAGETEDGGSIIFLNNGNVAELICDSVSYACFGAISDGNSNAPTNNYERIKACHLYANKTGKPVINYGGIYYVTGETIPVRTDVYNYDDTTYIIGTQNLKSDALFQWSHDSEENVTGVALSTVMSDEFVVTSDYINKAFTIKTDVSLGINQDTGEEDYIQEPMLAVVNKAALYMDSYNVVKDWIVDIKHITDAAEKGYTWDGGILRNYDTSTYGTCFLSASRNNCKIRNLTLACDSNKAEHRTIYANTANNLLIENIVVKSQSTEDTWGYWLESLALTNITVRNVRQSSNNVKTNGWGQRTVKNAYCINNTIKAYDCHWNAYGVHLVDNCQLYHHAHVGYGKGQFIVRNSTVAYYVGLRPEDFVPIYAGDIIVEDCILGLFGIWLRSVPTIDSTRDMTYFAQIPVPRIYAKRNISKQLINARAVSNYLPAAITDILEDRIKIVLEEYKRPDSFFTGDETPKCKHFEIILKEYKHTHFSDLSSFYNNIDTPHAYFRVIYSKLILVDDITFNSSVQIAGADPIKFIRNKNGTIFLTFNFVGDINVAAWGTLGSVSNIIKPIREVHFLLASGTNTFPCFINENGTIVSIRAINLSASRFTASASW